MGRGIFVINNKSHPLIPRRQLLVATAGVLTVTAGGTVPELRRLAHELSPQLPSGTSEAIQFGYRLARRRRKVNYLVSQKMSNIKASKLM